MANGLDNFETKWTSNENYVSSFTGTNTSDAAFVNLLFGTFNLSTNVFTVNSGYSLPEYGKQLIATVQTQTGAGVSPSVLTIQYLNQSNVLKTTSLTIVEGLPQNRSFLVPLAIGDTGVLSIATISRTNPKSGTLAFYGPLNLIEDFQTNWGPADPGL